MTDESTPDAPRNRRTLRLLAAGGATAALLAAGSVAAFAASGTGTATPKPTATASPGTPGQPGAGTRPSRLVHKPHMAGTVTAVSGSTITITDWDGFAREIKVSGSTTYTGGLTAVPKIGDKIHAEGTVDADKTSLDATTIGLMSEHAPHGPGGTGGRGPGGPGGPGGMGRPDGHGPGGPAGPRGTAAPRPSGSATPSPSTKP
jgi:Domain of unknown function (DUF5666)